MTIMTYKLARILYHSPNDRKSINLGEVNYIGVVKTHYVRGKSAWGLQNWDKTKLQRGANRIIEGYRRARIRLWWTWKQERAVTCAVTSRTCVTTARFSLARDSVDKPICNNTSTYLWRGFIWIKCWWCAYFLLHVTCLWLTYATWYV